MHIRNEHVRRIARPPSLIFGELEALGTDGDRIWPAPSIPFERTPGPLRVGETHERHGIIQAVLDELQPGERLVWRADQSFIKGTHGFELEATDDGCRVAHILDADLAWWFAPVWVLKMRALHDRIVERLLQRLADAA